MTVVVFTGPTLEAETAAREIDAIFLPPVSQGDVYSVARDRPWGIGIIDGYFERVPAVWHKEILWAMSRGVHVFGSASMGALRAAELESFGMEGVGRIFEAYRDGEIEDDDEVAVTHGPAESGYRTLSEAMVNIRFTLEAAVEAEVITDEARRRLVNIAKSLFYPERVWPEIFALAAQETNENPRPAELDALRSWLPGGRVDRKRLDAIEMLAELRRRAGDERRPKAVRFSFQHTDAWDEVRRRLDRRPMDREAGADTHLPDAVLEEARLEGETYRLLRESTLVRALSLDVARHEGMKVKGKALEDTIDGFRRDLGLHLARDFENWRAEQEIREDEFLGLMRDEARVRRIRTMVEADLDRQLPDQLRVAGRYRGLALRARDKERRLAERGLDNPGLEDAGVGDDELWRWYFEQQLGVAVPQDLESYAASFDFEGVDALRRAVLRELLFLRTTEGES